MSRALDDLLELLKLEPIEENLFRGHSQDLGFPQLFGGQVLGQSLSAASQTVSGRPVHSLHGYFLRPGNASLPVVYTVDRVRDGGSFTTRRVVAIQKGETIFTMMASFQGDEPGFEHQTKMPDVPSPESLAAERERLGRPATRVSERLRDPGAVVERPLDILPVIPTDSQELQAREPVKHLWFRANGALPDNARAHRYLLAYASDFNLITTALLPHAVSPLNPRMQLASLDHALWFHGDLRMDDWLLYSLGSPWAGNARGLSYGNIFTREGRLVASVAQEGLMRMRPPKP